MKRGPVTEKRYRRVRGCLFVFLIIFLVLAVSAGFGATYLSQKNPIMFNNYVKLLRDKIDAFFFPPVIELEGTPEPNVYLQSFELEYCGRDYTSSLPALRILFDNSGFPRRESSQNILDNMVRFRRSGSDFCSGLRVTTDGFILTAHHCVDRYELPWSRTLAGLSLTDEMHEQMTELRTLEIIDRHEHVHFVDVGFLATYPIYDLAMIKADIATSDPEAVCFNMHLEDPEIADPIQLLAFKKGTLMIYDGAVIAPTIDRNFIDNTDSKSMHPRMMEDILFTNVYIEGGFSGGVIISPSGSLMGTNAWGTNFMISDDDLASGHAKARHIDTLFRRVYDDLHRTDTSECSEEQWEGL